jgi:hypothetical protein
MKENRIKKINVSVFIIIGLILSIFILAFYFKNSYENKIKSYSGSTIGFASSIKIYPKSKDLIYYFYNDDAKIIAISYENNFTKNNLNRFYIVKFNEENPNESHIYLNKEIQPDSITLTKAGFKYVTYYEHDIPTNTYIKKHKWE